MYYVTHFMIKYTFFIKLSHHMPQTAACQGIIVRSRPLSFVAFGRCWSQLSGSGKHGKGLKGPQQTHRSQVTELVAHTGDFPLLYPVCKCRNKKDSHLSPD